jgi:protein involved in polysaccharide export with SLBB domain
MKNINIIHTGAFILGVFMWSAVSFSQTPDTAAAVDTASQHPVCCDCLNPGDALQVVAYPDTGFPNGVFLIDDEGYAELPLLGRVEIVSLGKDALQEQLKKAYTDQMRYPSLTIKPLMRISLLGGFQRPGLYWIDPRMNLWEAAARAGGPVRSDGVKKILWERDRSIVDKDMVPQYQSGQSLCSMGFRSGDQLTIKPRPERTGWEVFRSDVLPILTTSLTAATASLSAYIAYQTYKERQ